jgi:hypothetical protein
LVILGGDPRCGLVVPLDLQVGDLAEKFTDAGPLTGDLGVGVVECVFGVERPFSPDASLGVGCTANLACCWSRLASASTTAARACGLS